MIWLYLFLQFQMILLAMPQSCFIANKFNGPITKALSNDVTPIAIRSEVMSIMAKVKLRFPGQIFYGIGHNCTRLPVDQLPSTMSVLVLRQGSLDRLTNDELAQYSGTIEYIDLSRNRLSHLGMDLFDGLTYLQEVDITFNNIFHFGDPGNDLSPTSMMRSSLWKLTLNLKGNPLECSCSISISYFRHFVVREEDATFCFVESVNSTNFFDTSMSFGQLKIFESRIKRSCLIEKHNFHDWFQLKSTEKIGIAPNKHSKIVSGHIASPSEDIDQNPSTERLIHRHWRLDTPLLLTMAFWFIMVFVGLSKFVRSNALEYELHKEYLDKLDEQENTVVTTQGKDLAQSQLIRDPGKTMKRNVCTSLTSLRGGQII